MDDRIFDFAYLLAFRDATQRKAYPKRNQNDRDFQMRKQEVFVNSKDPVREYVEEIFNDNHPDPVPIICSICDEERYFTFGNAQKLVNMVAKYMYIADYSDESKRNKFINCHCPMDGCMIDCVNENYPEDKIKVSWSQLEYRDGVVPTEYLKFQKKVEELIGEGVSPLEYDYMNW